MKILLCMIIIRPDAVYSIAIEQHEKIRDCIRVAKVMNKRYTDFKFYCVKETDI